MSRHTADPRATPEDPRDVRTDRPGRRAAPDRLPAGAPARGQLPDQGLPRCGGDPADRVARRGRGPAPRPAPCAQLPGIGAKTAAIVEECLAGEVPAYLAELEDTAGPLVEGGEAYRAALRGDLHTHSDWSDGGSPIEEMAMTAIELGHEYVVLTDHSPRLTRRQRAVGGPAHPAARGGRRGQRAPRRAGVPAAARASRWTSSTTARSTRPTRCSAGSTWWSPPCTPSCGWTPPR